jgi:hypothetical protein
MLGALLIGGGIVALIVRLMPRTAEGQIDMWSAEP